MTYSKLNSEGGGTQSNISIKIEASKIANNQNKILIYNVLGQYSERRGTKNEKFIEIIIGI